MRNEGHEPDRPRPIWVGVAVALIALSTVVMGSTVQSPKADAFAHPLPFYPASIGVNTIHPMSAGFSQPSFPGAGRCLTIMFYAASAYGSPINQWPCGDPYSATGTDPYTNGSRDFQHWTLRGSANYPGAVNIVNAGTGQCIDVPASSMGQGVALIAHSCYDTANQAFQQADMGNGTVGYVAVHSGQCLDMDDSGYSYWAHIRQMNCNFLPSQTYTVHGDNIGNYMVAGYVDNLSASAAGIHAQGWAITPQAPWSWLALRTVVDGEVITPTYQTTGSWRPDVNSYWWNGYGNDRGFNFTEPYLLPVGWHYVCIQAQSYGFYATLGCQYIYSGENQWDEESALPEISWPRNAAPTSNQIDNGYASSYQAALYASIDRISTYSSVNLTGYKAKGRVGCPLGVLQQSGILIGTKFCHSGMANNTQGSLVWSVPLSYGQFTCVLASDRFVVNFRHFVPGSSTTQDERDAVVAHEIAHLIYPANSEDLTDCQAKKWMGGRGSNAYYYINVKHPGYVCPP